MSDSHASASPQQQYPSSWILLLALLTSLGPLSIDMYLPALPQMADDFGVSTQMVAKSLPAYFLGLAIGQLIYGPLSDRIGRKTPLYFGLGLYFLASLLCVYAQDEWSLIAARVLQALGGCVGVVIARAAIRDRLDMQASAQAFSSMMIVTAIAPIIAPGLGAIVLSFFDWQAIFVCLAMMSLVCWLCVHFFFQESLPPERRLKLNFYQVLTLYLAIFKDRSFYLPMIAGCFTGGAMFCYISSSAAVLMDGYGLPHLKQAIGNQQLFNDPFKNRRYGAGHWRANSGHRRADEPCADCCGFCRAVFSCGRNWFYWPQCHGVGDVGRGARCRYS